jgi:hypothetical protein
MKLIFLFISLLFAVSLKAQSGSGGKGNFDLLESNVNKTNVYSRQKKLVAHIISLGSPHVQMWLRDCQQSKAVNGKYVTEFSFVYPDSLISNTVMITLNFDGEVDTVTYAVDGSAITNDKNTGTTKYSSFLSIAKMPYKGIVTATVVSDKKVFTAITGAKGKLEN